MTTLPIKQIEVDNQIQSRVTLDLVTIGGYAGAMLAGVTFPAVIVFYDGSKYWLADGFHRVKAAIQAGLESISADVRPGDRRAAILFSAGANSTHGLRRSNDDKRRAVMALLTDNEWSRWSDSEIARQTNTSHTFVAKLRGNLETLQDSPRLARRGDSVYEIKTGNIGQAQELTEAERIIFNRLDSQLDDTFSELRQSISKIGSDLRAVKQALTPDQFTAWLASEADMTPTEAEFFMTSDRLNLGDMLDNYFVYFQRRFNIQLEG